jgi:signal transduction histidine kinase
MEKLGFQAINSQTVESLIREKVELEERLQKQERIIKYLLLLGGTIRHDGNNLLTSISAYANLSIDGAPEEREDFLKKNIELVKKLSELMTIWKKYENSYYSWQNTNDLLSHCTNKQCKEIKVLIDNQADFVKVYSSNLACRIFDDFFDNTLRHGEKATQVRVSCYLKGENLFFVYEDDGIGVLPEDKENIFMKGFGKNTGLGLFLVRQILSITGSTVCENGEYGSGVRFVIKIPKTAYKIM